jgi:hypothetical protein
MIIKQESISANMGFKDLPAKSPLPTANLVLTFGSISQFSDAKLAKKLRQRFPEAQIVGCSSSGEISAKGAVDDSLQITAIQWEKSQQKVLSTKMNDMQNSFDVAVSLAHQLKAEGLKTILLFTDGLHVNGSELLDGFQSVLGNIPIVGGMAGDSAAFVKTLQIMNDDISEKQVIAVGIYGDSLMTANGALGGWKPYGPPRKITKSIKNVVYEMDDKPALPLYKLYIGDAYAKDLPGSGLKFPLAIIEDGKREVEKIRTLLGVDTKTGSLTFAGNVEEGETVRLCQSTHDRLIEGASGAAQMITAHLAAMETAQNALALCVSCVGRKLVMAEKVSDEITAVQNILGKQTAITGFYSYGEFAPRPNTTDNVLHNQTMTIAYITEL